jgi:hypothetical protein
VLPVGSDPVLLAEPAGGHALERVHQDSDRHLRRVLDQQVHVVVFPVALRARSSSRVLAEVPLPSSTSDSHRDRLAISPACRSRIAVSARVR